MQEQLPFSDLHGIQVTHELQVLSGFLQLSFVCLHVLRLVDSLSRAVHCAHGTSDEQVWTLLVEPCTGFLPHGVLAEIPWVTHLVVSGQVQR